MPKQIAGNVYWIENGKQTNHAVDVKEAFSDPVQAKEQIIHSERMGDKAHLKLARLAFRQFQGMRYRRENKPKPKRSTEVNQQRISKPKVKKDTRPVSSKQPVRRKVEKEASVKKAVKKTARKK